MLDLLDFITYGEVRSTVGLATDTLPDSVLELEMYANVLELALDDITVAQEDLNPVKETFLSIGESNSTFYNRVRMFSIYTVALEVAVSLSMRAPKLLSDSKVSIGRFGPEATWQDVIKEIKEKLGKYKEDIEDIGDTTTQAANQLLTAVSPSYDPVTGA